MPTTPDDRFGVSVDVLSDGPPDGPHVFYNEIVAPITTKAALYDQGTFALRPVSTPGTPGIKGRFYLVVGDADPSKNGIVWLDYGTGWYAVAFGSVEIDSNTRTTPIDVTVTTEGGATTIINGHSVAYDGGRVKIEAWVPRIQAAGSTSAVLMGVLYRDSTSLGRFYLCGQDDRGLDVPGNLSVNAFDTPAVGNHVYSLRAFVVNDSSPTTFTVVAGTGLVGNYLPAFLRVLKA